MRDGTATGESRTVGRKGAAMHSSSTIVLITSLVAGCAPSFHSIGTAPP
jgi:hypothetical protein